MSIFHKTVRSAALLLALVAGAANASVITIQFNAAVSNLRTYNTVTSESVNNLASSDLPGHTIALGDSMSGYFTFDTNMARSPFQTDPGAYGTYTFFSGPVDAQLVFNATGNTYHPTNSINYVTVSDNAAIFGGTDVFAVFVYTLDQGPYYDFSLSLLDSSGNAVDGDYIAAHPDTSAFSYQVAGFTWFGGSEILSVDASMSSVRFVQEGPANPVPEPSAIFLLMAGIGALVFALSRRATAPK